MQIIRPFLSIVFLALMTSNMRIEDRQPVAASCLQMDIMLLGDFSASVDGHEKFVTDAFSAFVNKFDLDENGLKIGVIGFSNDATLISPLTSDKEKISTGIDKWVESDYGTGGTTNMKDAMFLAMNEFTVNGRTLYRKLLIVVSDGKPDSPDQVLAISEQFKSMNIGVCGVLIVAENYDDKYMKNLSSNFCYVETDYNNLIEELKKMDICL